MGRDKKSKNITLIYTSLEKEKKRIKPLFFVLYKLFPTPSKSPNYVNSN